MNPPSVFVSYSHDSAQHKKWVLDLATTLRNRGVDAILDQWDLKPGDDLPEFMERNLASADYAVMICTKRYVERANAGTGGVGYEKMIMTAASLEKISGNNVIPVVREKGEPPVPTFLSTKLYIDFSDDEEIEYSLDELLRLVLDAPLYEKPQIGASPFAPLSGSRPDRVSDGVKSAMSDIAKAFDSISVDYVQLRNLINVSKLRRLTLDKYLRVAEEQGLIIIEKPVPQSTNIYLTQEGRNYLDEHGILQD